MSDDWGSEPTDREHSARVRRAIDDGVLIPAKLGGWPRPLLNSYIHRTIRRSFHAVRAQGIERVRQSIAEQPGGTLFLGNHSSWWDVFLAHFLNEAVPVEGYGMMEHFNLKRFGFFQHIGCFSVERSNPASVRAALSYTTLLLRRPRAGIWLFPQGRILGNEVRPIVFQPGLRAVVKMTGRVRLVTVALKFEFWQEQRPEAFARFGPPTWVDHSDLDILLPTWERRLTEELDALKVDVLAQAPGRFQVLARGSRSIHESYARLRERFRGPTPGAPAHGDDGLPGADR